MTTYTASGARRTGDEYQDLLSAEVLIEWLEQPEVYRWVRLETMDGSLDDIQVERTDGSRRLLQVKFGTDPTVEWDLDDLIRQEPGKKGPKPSLLQKWQASYNDVVAAGVTVSEAALLTNRAASAAIRAHLSESGLLNFDGFPVSWQSAISQQLGGQVAASAFFGSFHFFFRKPTIGVLEAALQERFRRLGGNSEGWESLIRHIRRWINHQNEPSPGGTITLADVYAAALWHLPAQIPQGFIVPEDYVAPTTWSNTVVVPRLRASDDPVVVVTGSPGGGKSTYLSWLVDHLRNEKVPVVRHHYFLSTTDATPRRTDWETAADAIIGQLRTSYPELVQSVCGQNPLPGTLREFLVAAGRARVGREPVLVVVDGLDHVWRDTGSAEGLRRLFDLLLPTPDGVAVVVGTQDIDITKIPRKLRDLCPREKWVAVPVLDGDAVHAWLQHHEHDLGLPKDKDHADRLLGELVDAFHAVSGGHPLVLHYTLQAARQGGASINPDRIRVLPNFDPNSDVATYYQTLWDSISPEGHQLLHLLAGFPWAWPRDGLVQCLAPHADPVRLEQAERAIRHVLGTSRAGVTAFHESLLAFVRALPDHKDSARLLRSPVIDWLSDRAPEYWKWRHEWEQRARNGDTTPLISSATLNWCVDSLAAGRWRQDVAKVVAASGWAALKEGRLGVATERHYMDAYLEEARHDDSVLARLVWVSLCGLDADRREVELNLFLSRKAHATVEEIEAVAEVAFSSGHHSFCQELLNELAQRWDAAVRRSNRMDDRFSSLRQTFPLLIAANLTAPSKGPYQHHVREHNEDPSWCSRGRYARSLARLCAVGDATAALREELRFLANQRVSFQAVDEIVRLACRDSFDPGRWVENLEARRSGLFRCHRLWIQRPAEIPAESPREVSFRPVWENRFGQNKSAFIELARSYFFSCLASAAEGRHPAEATGVDARADRTATFLSLLRDIAVEAATSKKGGQTLGAAWLIARLATLKMPAGKPHDLHNTLVAAGPVAQIVVAIAYDLEALHYAETGRTSLTRDVMAAALEGTWTWAREWIDHSVERRIAMGDSEAARLLIDRERARLQESRDYLPTRAVEYASLAQFCLLHQQPAEEVRTLARLAARNLLGHGNHKDMVLFDLLAAITAAPVVHKTRTIERLQAISPIVQVVHEITDGDETSHLKRELAGVIAQLAPEALPDYLQTLQRDHHHWIVETCFTDVARSGPLETVYERALAGTLVHEAALTALQERAENGDIVADSLLADTLTYSGRQAPARKQDNAGSTPSTHDSDRNSLPVEDYPPERLAEFVRAVRDANIYGDEPLAAWTNHWRAKDPDRLLDALTAYRMAHGSPHEKQSAKAVVELAVERSGRAAAWDWIVAYHESSYGWIKYASRLDDVEWIWAYVRDRFSNRWPEFIAATSRPRWGTAGGAPGWSVERMVRFLVTVGEGLLVDEVLDAAVGWCAGLAADMRLPPPAVTSGNPDLPVALQLLVDRLDCPSRMVQERAAWSLAGLLAAPDTQGATARALLDWHGAVALELRSCMLLLILHLARAAHGTPVDTCILLARQANVVPSIGADMLLRDFEDGGAVLSATLDYRTQHSGRPDADFSGVDNFEATVSGHLAPIFSHWAVMLDDSGIPFSRQWEWEATCLAKQQGLSLRLNAHFDYHFRGSADEPTLAINDRLSVVLRSAYLRALHWAIDQAGLDVERAEIHARRVGVMADPALWAVRPSQRPDWWPAHPGDADGLDMLSAAVGRAVKNRLENRNPDEDEVLLFAAGPVGNGPHFRANVTIRALLQAAYGPLKPQQVELAETPSVGCHPVPLRISLPGPYKCFEAYAGPIRDWLVAPLAWGVESTRYDWLLPDRQTCGVFVPPAWLLPREPTITTEPDRVRVTINDQPVARYQYWHDELRERHFRGTGSRAGCQLLIHRKWLEPHLERGATLCWIVTLEITQREKYENQFDAPQLVGTWVVGGSHLVRVRSWQP